MRSKEVASQNPPLEKLRIPSTSRTIRHDQPDPIPPTNFLVPVMAISNGRRELRVYGGQDVLDGDAVRARWSYVDVPWISRVVETHERRRG